MCGLTGYLFAPGSAPEHAVLRQSQAMADAIAHRGPDSGGAWCDVAAGITLGHRRLAILDLSEAGHQPMLSASGRYAISYNGEIYNHDDLRAELKAAGRAPTWRGHSDTETLVAGFDAWGIEATVVRTVGMFAMAIWDRERRVLSLVRDRMGEKPLYYGWQGQGPGRVFLFGSELKALAAHPALERRIDRDSIVELMRHSYVGGARAIYEGIAKVRPGEIVEISYAAQAPAVRLYWSVAEVAARGSTGPADPTAAIEALETLLLDATRRQMASDVPLGAFLSGGIDSSLVVSLMQSVSDQPVHTFSIGFHEPRYNEAVFARAVSDHLGTRHTELYVGDAELRSVIPRLPELYDEPFADPSQIPTFLIAGLARRHVTVAISGDGGDELFCGYDRYRQGAALMGGPARIPLPLRRLAADGVRRVPMGAWDRVIDPFRPVPEGKEPNGQRLHRLADYLRARSVEDLHRKMVSFWRFPEVAVIGGRDPPGVLHTDLPEGAGLGPVERMMQLDTLAYLPNDILTKVDRATMAVSLESRAPLLDHRVTEFAWSLPLEFKLRDGQSKWPLRQVLYRRMPQQLIERPKQGFEVPIGLWLRSHLRDWAEALLDRHRLAGDGWFDPDVVGQVWAEHLSGRCNWGLQLWNVLMFQAWLEAQAGTATTARVA